jgi:hypothetical protein
VKGITYGVEYEFGDIHQTSLPQGLSWNKKDYSIVSSTGIANDPKGVLYTRGGEINSKPTSSIEEQMGMFNDLMRMHPEATVNHRTNLHLHIGIPGLSENLGLLQTVLSYAHQHEDEIYKLIEPIPSPLRTEYSTEEEYKGARKRYNRRKVSHQYRVPAARVEKALRAETVSQFLAAHAPVMKTGAPAWALTTRAGINLLQIKETETIEFRHFTCTKDPLQLESCFVWVSNFVDGVLDGATPTELAKSHPFVFPNFAPYDHAMEQGYSYTNFDKHSRKVVAQRLEDLRKEVDINSCTAEETVETIRRIDPTHAL